MSSIGGMVHLFSTQVSTVDMRPFTHAGVNCKYSWAPFSSVCWDVTPLTKLEGKSKCMGETGLQKELLVERTFKDSFLSPARVIPARLSILLDKVSE